MNYRKKIQLLIIIVIFVFFYQLSRNKKINSSYKNDFLDWIEKNSQKFNSLNDFNIYFVKTHKTASSALQNVLIRLADKRNMRVINDLKKEKHLKNSHKLNNKIYFFHGRHKTEIAEEVFTRNRSLYMTILRNPADQLLSSINYFSSLKNEKNNIIKNIENESVMKSLGRKSKIFCLLKNSASYDLGYVECAESYRDSDEKLIERFKKEFDLVILTEYFNEGLILLKNVLNLSYKDIVCLSVNQGTKRPLPSERLWAESIASKVSKADLLLYNYYLSKYKILSKLMREELEKLGRLREFYEKKCTNGREKKKFYGDVPYIGYALRTRLTEEYKDFCWKLTSTELDMIDYITKKSREY